MHPESIHVQRRGFMPNAGSGLGCPHAPRCPAPTHSWAPSRQDMCPEPPTSLSPQSQLLMTHRAHLSAIGVHGSILSSPSSQGLGGDPQSHGVPEGIPVRCPTPHSSDQVLLAAPGAGGSSQSSQQPKGRRDCRFSKSPWQVSAPHTHPLVGSPLPASPPKLMPGVDQRPQSRGSPGSSPQVT